MDLTVGKLLPVFPPVAKAETEPAAACPGGKLQSTAQLAVVAAETLAWKRSGPDPDFMPVGQLGPSPNSVQPVGHLRAGAARLLSPCRARLVALLGFPSLALRRSRPGAWAGSSRKCLPHLGPLGMFL